MKIEGGKGNQPKPLDITETLQQAKEGAVRAWLQTYLDPQAEAIRNEIARRIGALAERGGYLNLTNFLTERLKDDIEADKMKDHLQDVGSEAMKEALQETFEKIIARPIKNIEIHVPGERNPKPDRKSRIEIYW